MSINQKGELLSVRRLENEFFTKTSPVTCSNSELTRITTSSLFIEVNNYDFSSSLKFPSCKEETVDKTNKQQQSIKCIKNKSTTNKKRKPSAEKSRTVTKNLGNPQNKRIKTTTNRYYENESFQPTVRNSKGRKPNLSNVIQPAQNCQAFVNQGSNTNQFDQTVYADPATGNYTYPNSKNCQTVYDSVGCYYTQPSPQQVPNMVNNNQNLEQCYNYYYQSLCQTPSDRGQTEDLSSDLKSPHDNHNNTFYTTGAHLDYLKAESSSFEDNLTPNADLYRSTNNYFHCSNLPDYPPINTQCYQTIFYDEHQQSYNRYMNHNQHCQMEATHVAPNHNQYDQKNVGFQDYSSAYYNPAEMYYSASLSGFYNPTSTIFNGPLNGFYFGLAQNSIWC